MSAATTPAVTSNVVTVSAPVAAPPPSTTTVAVGASPPIMAYLLRILAILAGIIIVAFLVRWLFGNSCKGNPSSIACSLQRVATAIADTVQAIASNLWVIVAGAVVYVLGLVGIKIYLKKDGGKGHE